MIGIFHILMLPSYEVQNLLNKTKNFEKRFDKMLTRIDNIERNINELTELKNTTQKLSKICTSLNS